MITEQLMKAGSFDVKLIDSTPVHIRDQLTEGGYIVVSPVHLELAGLDDTTILALARYSGVIEERTSFSLSGSGLASLCLDAGGKGLIAETELAQAGDLTDWVNVIFSLNGIGQGGIASTGTSITKTFPAWMPYWDMWQYICAALGAEWWMSPTGTIFANVPSALWTAYTTPRVILLRADGGYDGQIFGLVVDQMTRTVDMHEWTSRTLVIGEGEGATVLVDGANVAANPYLAWDGTPLVKVRLIDSPTTAVDTSGYVAQATQDMFSEADLQIDVSVDVYDICRYLYPGDSVYVYDPEQDLFDATQAVMYRGELLMPWSRRLYGYTYPIQFGMGVYYRTGAGLYVDLTPYVEFETGSTSLEVGFPHRSMDPDQFLPTSMTGRGANHAILERVSR